MKMIIAAALGLILTAGSALADGYVNGYYRGNGTYVQPYYRSSPDGNPFNNYSTQGNVNPYTGQPGTHNPYGYGSGSYYDPYGR